MEKRGSRVAGNHGRPAQRGSQEALLKACRELEELLAEAVSSNERKRTDAVIHATRIGETTLRACGVEGDGLRKGIVSAARTWSAPSRISFAIHRALDLRNEVLHGGTTPEVRSAVATVMAFIDFFEHGAAHLQTEEHMSGASTRRSDQRVRIEARSTEECCRCGVGLTDTARTVEAVGERYAFVPGRTPLDMDDVDTDFVCGSCAERHDKVRSFVLDGLKSMPPEYHPVVPYWLDRAPGPEETAAPSSSH